jgi:predicted exporter
LYFSDIPTSFYEFLKQNRIIKLILKLFRNRKGEIACGLDVAQATVAGLAELALPAGSLHCLATNQVGRTGAAPAA